MSADVHREAAVFLSGLLKQRQADRVIVVREQAPKYLVGFKASGAAVFGYDVKLAKRFDAGGVELGEAVALLHGLEDIELTPASGKVLAAGA
jgi:hypothetical protein